MTRLTSITTVNQLWKIHPPIQYPGDDTGQVYQPFSEQGIPAFHTLLPDIQQDGILHRASRGLEEHRCDSQTGRAQEKDFIGQSHLWTQDRTLNRVSANWFQQGTKKRNPCNNFTSGLGRSLSCGGNAGGVQMKRHVLKPYCGHPGSPTLSPFACV